ncbi:MAG: S8 family peptidase [Planctomycetota bacterium]|jgi:subtilisin family serine protease
MDKTWLYKWVTIVIVTISIFCFVEVASAADPPYVPGQLLVRFAPKAKGVQRSMEEKNQILGSLGGGTIKRNFTIVPGLCLVELPEGQTVKDVLETFNKADEILHAERNYIAYTTLTIPNDTLFNYLWGMHNTGQTGGTADADIDAPEAWDVATDADDIIVAVIDTGVNYNHPDLAANMWVNEEEFYGDPDVDDDNNGYEDDIYGYDFINDDGDPIDDMFHGTHCAGTIGAVGDNDEGVVGVCWDVRIMALKFMDEGGSGSYADAISCIEYATEMGANVMSASWGGRGDSPDLKDAIDAADANGILFVAAAGNPRDSENPNNDENPFYPASFNSDNIIAVMATDHNDERSIWPETEKSSAYGPTSVDLAAPGTDIYSTFPTYMTPAMESRGFSRWYETIGGTSMATPHVAGACALLWAANHDLVTNHLVVKYVLMNEVDKIAELEDLCVSEGRLNLYNTLVNSIFCVKNNLDQRVARFDNFGNLYIKGTLYEQSSPEASDHDEFRFINQYYGTDVMIIDANTGDVYLDTSVYENQETLTPYESLNNFIIKNSSGDVVAYVDYAGLYLKGKVYENQ